MNDLFGPPERAPDAEASAADRVNLKDTPVSKESARLAFIAHSLSSENRLSWFKHLVKDCAPVLLFLFFVLVFAPAGQAQNRVPARIATAYALTSAQDYPAYDPSAWRLLASNDGIHWTTLDVQTKQFFKGRNFRRVFPLSNNTGYSIYRLQVDGAWAKSSASVNANVQLAEVELMGPLVGIDNETNLQEIITASDANPLMGPENAFDGDVGTRWMDFGLTHSNECWIQCMYARDSALLVTNVNQMQVLGRLAALRGSFSERGPEISSNLTAFAAKPPRTLTGYALTSANDEPERDLRNWRLLGSADEGKTWTTLDTRTNEIFASRFKRRVFTLSHPASFSTYRLEIDATGLPGNPVQLAEIEPLYASSETNTPVSLVVSAEADNPPTEATESAFDGDPKTKWLDFTITDPAKPCWIQWQYIPAEKDLPVINLRRLDSLAGNMEKVRKSAQAFSNLLAQAVMHRRVLTGYSLTSANDFPDRDPRDWRLLASNDGGKTWATLDARKNEVFTGRFQRRTFTVKNDKPYALYRLQINSVREPGTDATQLSGIDPIFAAAGGDRLSTVVSAQDENGPLEISDNLFDGKPATKWLDFSQNDETNRSSWIEWYYAADLASPVVNLDRMRDAVRWPALQHYSPPPVKAQLTGVAVCLDTNRIGFVDATGFQLFQLGSPVAKVRPGERVRLSGWLHFGQEFPTVSDLKLVALDPLDAVGALRIEQAMSTEQDFVSGVVTGRAGPVSYDGVFSTIELTPDTGPGRLTTKIFNPSHAPIASLAGKRLRVQGVAEQVYKDDGRRVPGVIWAADPNAVSSVEPVAANGSRPVEPAEQFDLEHPATDIRKINQLLNGGPPQAVPAKIRGVITYIDLNLGSFYVQSGAQSVLISEQMSAGVSPFLHQEGDYIEVKGNLHRGSFHPTSLVTVLGKGRMPEPVRHAWDYLMTGRDDGRWIQLEGVVSAFEQHRLTLAVTGGQLIVWINEIDKNLQTHLLGSVVRVQGVCGPVFNSRDQRLGQRLLVPSSDFIQIVKAAPENPFDMPTTAVGRVMQGEPDNTEQIIQLVKTAGVVTYVGPKLLFIQNDSAGIRVVPRQQIKLKPGDRVEAVGLAEPDGLSPQLNQALIRRIGDGKLPAANAVDLSGIFSDSGTSHDATRATVDATLVDHSIRDSVEVLELQSDTLKKSCYAFLPVGAEAGPAIPVGSRLRLEGVFKAVTDTVPDSGQVVTSFEMYLNSPADIAVLQRPSWWTARHALWTFSSLGGVLLFFLVWAGSLRGQVRRRTRELRQEIQEHERTELQLQNEIAERKRMEAEVADTHKELLLASHQAGMAEVATSVLHNVGNVLNSVNVSASVVSDLVRQSKFSGVARVAALIHEHLNDLGTFFSQDPKGRRVPEYLQQLSGYLADEQSLVLKEMESLNKNIDHIKDIVAMQQSYAKLSGITETVQVVELMEDAVRMNAGSLVRHDIQIVREYDSHVPPIAVQKHKVLQILVNLVRNAKYACDESGRSDKRMTLRVSNGDEFVRIIVSDNGIGIPPENLTKIFNHGFTTRRGGHGFGLHSGALAAKEMGGVLLAQSDGPNRGACFTLQLPLAPAEKN